MPEEPEIFVPPRFSEPEPREFSTVLAARGDVVDQTRAVASYTWVREVTLSFPVGNMPVAGVYVRPGDMVAAGDLVASLGAPEADAAMEDLRREISRAEFRLQQAEDAHRFALALAEDSGNPIDDARHRVDVENARNELEILLLQLGRVQGEVVNLDLHSPVDGIVTFAQTFREGMVSTANSRLVSIADPDARAFVVNTQNAVPFMGVGARFFAFIDGEEHLVEVVSGDERGFGGRPEWVNVAFLEFVDPPAVVLGNSAVINIVHDEARDVVFLPQNAVRAFGDRTYVYVVENGLRQVRDVALGVHGNGMVEIVSGLEEGEEVIL